MVFLLYKCSYSFPSKKKKTLITLTFSLVLYRRVQAVGSVHSLGAIGGTTTLFSFAAPVTTVRYLAVHFAGYVD